MNCSCEIFDGGESADFYKIFYPVARKDHKCCECNSIIQPGKKYEKIKGLWDGEFLTFKTCLSCFQIRDDYFSNCVPLGCLKMSVKECLGVEL